MIYHTHNETLEWSSCSGLGIMVPVVLPYLGVKSGDKCSHSITADTSKVSWMRWFHLFNSNLISASSLQCFGHYDPSARILGCEKWGQGEPLCHRQHIKSQLEEMVPLVQLRCIYLKTYRDMSPRQDIFLPDISRHMQNMATYATCHDKDRYNLVVQFQSHQCIIIYHSHNETLERSSCTGLGIMYPVWAYLGVKSEAKGRGVVLDLSYSG